MRQLCYFGIQNAGPNWLTITNHREYLNDERSKTKAERSRLEAGLPAFFRGIGTISGGNCPNDDTGVESGFNLCPFWERHLAELSAGYDWPGICQHQYQPICQLIGFSGVAVLLHRQRTRRNSGSGLRLELGTGIYIYGNVGFVWIGQF